MGKTIKIVSIALLTVLVVFCAIADMPSLQMHTYVTRWLGGLDGLLYLRLVSLAGLVIACFVAWGYKRKVETSHKFRRAQEVLSDAEAAAKRKNQELAHLEDKLKADFAAEEKRLRQEMARMQSDYEKKILAMKEKNVQLKDAVAKLMGTLKKKGV